MSGNDNSIFNLSEYHISFEYGFLIPEPLTELPKYFSPWMDLARQAASLAIKNQLRDEVNKLALLDQNRLDGLKQIVLAHSCLSSIGNCYVWQDGESGVPEKIPRNLAVPWMALSMRLGLNPVICYVDASLSNWVRLDSSKPIEVENMKAVLPMTPGGKHAELFWLVTIEVEAKFSPAFKHLLTAMQCSINDDTDGLTVALENITPIIKAMRKSMEKIHMMDAKVFYDEVRPYLFGWNDAILPGLIYEGASTQRIQCSGGSAAQSPAVQTIGALLGVVHNKDKEEFFQDARKYMMLEHRKFIEDVRDKSQVKQCVEMSKSLELNKAYNGCIKALADFRHYHMGVASKYVVDQMKKEKVMNDKGTAGSELIPFLKDIRNTTKSHLISEDKN